MSIETEKIKDALGDGPISSYLKEKITDGDNMDSRTKELTKPCSYCGQPIPDSGVFGLPTYTDVPENHKEDCPIREIMEVSIAREKENNRKKKMTLEEFEQHFLEGAKFDYNGDWARVSGIDHTIKYDDSEHVYHYIHLKIEKTITLTTKRSS